MSIKRAFALQIIDLCFLNATLVRTRVLACSVSAMTEYPCWHFAALMSFITFSKAKYILKAKWHFTVMYVTHIAPGCFKFACLFRKIRPIQRFNGKIFVCSLFCRPDFVSFLCVKIYNFFHLFCFCHLN